MTKLPVDTTATAMEMAQSMFGEGVMIVSASYTGDAASSGIFTSGQTVSPDAVPADTGVILSTGKASNFTSGEAINFNTSASTSTNTAGVNGDADMTSLIGRFTFDAAIFEAEFESTGE